VKNNNKNNINSSDITEGQLYILNSFDMIFSQFDDVQTLNGLFERVEKVIKLVLD